MTKTLEEIAQQLSSPQVTRKTVTKETKQIPPKEVEESKPVPKVQLIYAFNGTGKTRLSRAMKELIAPKAEDAEPSSQKILYYNAFTEDLFYWDNDLAGDAEPKLIIQPNEFTDWILRDRGLDQGIIGHFQRYTDEKLTPSFVVETRQITNKDGNRENQDFFPAVTFAFDRGTERITGVKISKGEESNFIWSVFYTLLEEVISVLNVPELGDRSTAQFNGLQYVFIDDPVSSLDENHLIELAVNLAGLIKQAPAQLRFVITTHSANFYNMMHNELNSKTCYLLEKLEDGTFELAEKHGDSNQSFSYHLHLMRTIELAHEEGRIEKYHFTLLRNLYEKTASFLGYPKWSELLPDDKQTYLNRVMQFASHSTLSNEVVRDPTPPEKNTVKFLLDHLRDTYGYKSRGAENG